MRTGRRRERRSEEPSVFREESMITRKTRCRRVFSVVDIHMGRWLEIGGHVGGEGDAVYIVGGDKTGIGLFKTYQFETGVVGSAGGLVEIVEEPLDCVRRNHGLRSGHVEVPLVDDIGQHGDCHRAGQFQKGVENENSV